MSRGIIESMSTRISEFKRLHHARLHPMAKDPETAAEIERVKALSLAEAAHLSRFDE